MSTTPPRRSRPKPPSNTSLPFVPIIIGVVVLGFVIGAGLSVMGRHGSGETVALATASPFGDGNGNGDVTPTPIPATDRTPHAIVTENDATPAPKPSPSRSASPRRTPEPQRSKAAVADADLPTPAPVASQTPAAAPTEAPVTGASPAVQTTSGTTSAPYTHRPSTPVPTLAATSLSTNTPSAAPPTAAAAAPAAAVLDSDSDFSRLAGNVVRQYLLSISRGDTESAYAALGDGPGSHPSSVPEAGAVDSTMHISKIQARGSDSAATVNVDLSTSAGSYYGQYTVRKSATGAAIIVSHTFGKP